MSTILIKSFKSNYPEGPEVSKDSIVDENIIDSEVINEQQPQNVSKLATFFKHRFAPPAFIYGEKTTQIMGDGFPNLFTKLSNRSQFVA